LSMSERPNFLLFVTDQHRADHLGCYGNPVVRTPHIDALAKRGLRFEQFYVTTPICMPNRAALATARMPSVNGVRHSGVPIPLEAVTFVDLLRAAGYRTALIGKAHFQTQSAREVADPYVFSAVRAGEMPPATLDLAVRQRRSGTEYLAERIELWKADPDREIARPYYGFDHVQLACGHSDQVEGHYSAWLRARHRAPASLRGPENALPHGKTLAPQAWRTRMPEELYPSAFIAERTIQFLKDAAGHAERGPPFFVQCSFPDPHHPFTPPGRYHDMYHPKDISLPASHGHVDPGEPAQLSRLREASAVPGFMPGPFTAQLAGADAVREAIALTYGNVCCVDDAIGRILDALDDLDIERSTVLIFTSDHGDLMGDHSLLFKQGFHYEGLIRVPFIWADPAVPAGASRLLGSTLDIGTSILARAQLAPSHGMQGENLLAAAQGKAALHREGVLIEEED
ncbi:MAG: sulfatase family protein, partial [Steroidobacteraceae bacterium]